MFKKNLKITTLSNLKNSDTRNLRQKCKKALANEDYDFPTNKIKQTNFETATNYGIIFTDDNDIPIWFKLKKSDIIRPTVYTAWNFYNDIPIIRTHDFIVTEKISTGDNLMVAGTVGPFDERLKPGVLSGIASTKNPMTIMAIGICKLDMSTFDTVIGKRGIAVEVIHWFGDDLTNVFDIKVQPPSISIEQQKDVGTDKDTESQLSSTVGAESVSVQSNSPETKIDDLAETLDEWRVEDIDHFLSQALYYSLTQDTSLNLPTSSSTFISTYLMKNLPKVDHNQVNIKKSSWKKAAKFLKHFEKEGVLKLKGKGDDLTIVSANKEHERLKTFVPYSVSKGKNSTGGKKVSQEQKDLMYCTIYYQPKKQSFGDLQEIGLKDKSYFTNMDVRNAFQEYTKQKKLANPRDKKSIIMNDTIFDLVVSKDKMNASRTIARAQVVDLILSNNFVLFHQIFQADGTPLTPKPAKGPQPMVRMITEKVRRGKVITRVSNFESFGISAKDLAHDLKVLCSGSTSIEDEPKGFPGPEVQVQGPHGNIVMDYFEKQHIPKTWFDFNNKVKPKKYKG